MVTNSRSSQTDRTRKAGSSSRVRPGSSRGAKSSAQRGSGSGNQSRLPLFLGVGGVLLALAAILIFSLSGESSEPELLAVKAAPPPPTSTGVLFVTRTLSRGESPDPVDFHWVDTPFSEIGPQDVRQDKIPSAPITLAQRVVLSSVEPVRPVHISDFQLVRGSEMAIAVPVGRRAYTVPVDDRTSIAGFLSAGDRVDVVLTTKVGPRSMSNVLMQNILVLAIDQKAIFLPPVPRPGSEDKGADNPSKRSARRERLASFLTVSITQEDAVKLSAAMSVGTLSFPLRNPFDEKILPDIKPKKDRSKQVWLLLGGSTIYRNCNPFCDEVLDTQAVKPNREHPIESAISGSNAQLQ